jgi:thiamine-monophosphate kinase
VSRRCVILKSVGLTVNPVFPCSKGSCEKTARYLPERPVYFVYAKLDANSGQRSLHRNPEKLLMKTPENDLLRKILGKSSRSNALKPGLRLGIGDDAALFVPRSGYETILTCDWFLEGTHFLRNRHPADSVGWKSLARAVSDVAAMGGAPRCFLLSLAIPRQLTGSWLTNFLSGLRRASHKLCCPIAGGDTTRQNRVLINVTVVGEVRSGRSLLRSNAKPGDIIYVSGRLGEAELGFEALRATCGKIRSSHPTLRKHCYPEPRIALGQWLADHRLATAAMDLSDGLSTDLARLCASSKVGAIIDRANLTAAAVDSASVPNGNKKVSLALNGGDDYELLFTVHPNQTRKIPASFHGLTLTPVGKITRDYKLQLTNSKGRLVPIKPAGWDPFA